MNFKLKLLRHLLKDNTQGLTIIEGLLAIVIVTLLIVAIGPVLAFAAATRIQARRVELASQAATAYLDSVRSTSLKPPPIVSPNGTPAETLSKLDAPATSLSCNKADISTYGGYCANPEVGQASILYCVDRNNNGECTTADDRKDFVIQAARALTSNGSSYLLSIRVYRADSFGAGLTLLKKSPNKPESKASILAGGSGNRVAPVVELTTEIPAS
ncbi:hormogonium polysaccharide secretion pseudopilin HpsB [Oscillatoria sp. FACHB-1406]|uniref:hormogonium polysaccharide secretion pseudopilin HpsB n=1 Tax=Oscillatoria sp. FACHB-1406 TaxID=2692846 RepID=UPI0016878897|nr:hormogonium polysaccharide secretion pseudopilin HpsB [Oscillatoria sp. FACHB-1406]MBD2577103.1 type II secretion system protein [Oscillatoria sp. FACHB-1406]